MRNGWKINKLKKEPNVQKEEPLKERVRRFLIQTREKYRELKRKRRQRRYENGDVVLPVFRVGPNKRGVAALWILMAASLAFGVYKNFTAIDKETIHETTVVEAKVTDTNAVESFVERFAYVYHAWGTAYEDKRARLEGLGHYMTAELVNMNQNAVSSECPTASEVEHVRICEVMDLENGDYAVRYGVTQLLTEHKETETASIEKKEHLLVATGEFNGTLTGETAEDREMETEESIEAVESMEGILTEKPKVDDKQEEDDEVITAEVESFYKVVVHADESGDMVIVKNPTVCGMTGKSEYTPSAYPNDGSVDAATMAEVGEFLDTFFALYPSASEKEMLYYAAPDTMEVINADFVYGGLMNPVYYLEDGQLMVHTYIKYLDQTAKMTQIAEYTLTLEKADNWKIVKAE